MFHKSFIKIPIVTTGNFLHKKILLFILVADRVVLHGPVTFQSFTFTPRLLQRTIDLRHICFSNMPIETNHTELYIDTVSMPYKKMNYEYYQNDKQIIVVEYDEDIGKNKFERSKNFIEIFI